MSKSPLLALLRDPSNDLVDQVAIAACEPPSIVRPVLQSLASVLADTPAFRDRSSSTAERSCVYQFDGTPTARCLIHDGTAAADEVQEAARHGGAVQCLTPTPAEPPSLPASRSEAPDRNAIDTFRDHVAFTMGRARLGDLYDEIVDGLDNAIASSAPGAVQQCHVCLHVVGNHDAQGCIVGRCPCGMKFSLRKPADALPILAVQTHTGDGFAPDASCSECDGSRTVVCSMTAENDPGGMRATWSAPCPKCAAAPECNCWTSSATHSDSCPVASAAGSPGDA